MINLRYCNSKYPQILIVSPYVKGRSERPADFEDEDRVVYFSRSNSWIKQILVQKFFTNFVLIRYLKVHSLYVYEKGIKGNNWRECTPSSDPPAISQPDTTLKIFIQFYRTLRRSWAWVHEWRLYRPTQLWQLSLPGRLWRDTLWLPGNKHG